MMHTVMIWVDSVRYTHKYFKIKKGWPQIFLQLGRKPAGESVWYEAKKGDVG